MVLILDDARPHFAEIVHELENIFLVRWLGQESTHAWPSLVPDQIPLDFNVWECLNQPQILGRPTES